RSPCLGATSLGVVMQGFLSEGNPGSPVVPGLRRNHPIITTAQRTSQTGPELGHQHTKRRSACQVRAFKSLTTNTPGARSVEFRESPEPPSGAPLVGGIVEG